MLDHTGCPLLEMFLRRAPDGSLEQRLAAMRGSDMSAEDGPASIEQQLVDSLAAFSNGKGTITVCGKTDVHFETVDSIRCGSELDSLC